MHQGAFKISSLLNINPSAIERATQDLESPEDGSIRNLDPFGLQAPSRTTDAKEPEESQGEL